MISRRCYSLNRKAYVKKESCPSIQPTHASSTHVGIAHSLASGYVGERYTPVRTRPL